MPIPYDWTAVFTDLGQVVRAANRGKVAAGNLDTDKLAQPAIFDDDADDADFLAQLLQSTESAASTSRAMWGALAELATGYTRGIMRQKLDTTAVNDADILADLLAKMDDDSETVKANEVIETPPWAEAGDASNQVSGYEDLRGISSATTELVGTGWVLYVEIVSAGGPPWRIDLYKDSALGAGDLVGHSADFTLPGQVAISPDNASGVGGYLTVDAVVGVDSITVTYDGQAVGTGDGYLSAWAATQMAAEDDVTVECVSVAGGAGAELWSITSRLQGELSDRATTGVAYPSATQTDQLGISFTITAGAADFVVGDYFSLRVGSTETGIFQTFWRDHFSLALPSDGVGAETISDSLATP